MLPEGPSLFGFMSSVGRPCATRKRGLTPEQVSGIDSYANLRRVVRSETSALETVFIPTERRLG